MFWAPIVIYGIDAVFQAAKLKCAVNYLLELREKLKVKEQELTIKDGIEILIPVLNEQEIVADTIEYFLKIIKSTPKAKGKIYLTFIGSCKEDGNKRGTLKAASIHLKKRGIAERVNLVRCPIAGSKATQLNYYIRKSPTKNTWYVIFDVDSRPEPNFLEILLKTKLKASNIYQMIPNYLLNISKQSNTVQDALSINQTIFSINTEFYNAIEKKLKIHNFVSNSVIGHGLILHSRLLRKMGGFPDPIEDSRLANLASLKQIRVKFLPIFDYSTVPSNLFVAIKQYSGWFYGQTFIFQDMAVIFTNFFGVPLYFKFLHRLSINLYWLLKTPFVVGTILIASATLHFDVLILFLFLVFLNHLKILYLNKIIHNEKLTLKHVFRSVTWDFFYSLGPIFFLFRLIRKLFSRCDIEFLPKTEKAVG